MTSMTKPPKLRNALTMLDLRQTRHLRVTRRYLLISPNLSWLSHSIQLSHASSLMIQPVQ
jgi:hypothetical protein